MAKLSYYPKVSTRKTGASIENIVCNYLKKQGLRLLKQNYQGRFGEIDLIMNENDCIVFIEVRYRKINKYGSGAETITTYKQQRIIKTAYQYLKQYQLFEKQPCRFDVVSVSENQQKPDINWIKNAFELEA